MTELNHQVDKGAGHDPLPMDIVDLDKFRRILFRSLPFLAIILAISFSISFVSIRYTRPLYQSESVIQIDVKSEAKVLGFKSFDEDINVLSREIEIIKSRLFLSKVAEALNYEVSYFQYGDILFEERYLTSPFKVNILNCPTEFLDKKIDLNIYDEEYFSLKFPHLGDTGPPEKIRFSDTLDYEGLRIQVERTPNYHPDQDSRYFFTINQLSTVVSYLNSNLDVEPLDFKAKTIKVSFKDHSRYKARDIVTAVDTLYIYYTQLEQNKANKQRIDFLNDQLRQTEDKLTDLERYFENFTIINKTTNLDANLARTIAVLEQLDSQRFYIHQQIEAFNTIHDKIIMEEQFDLNPAEVAVFSAEMRAELNRLNTLFQDKQLLLRSYNQNTLTFQKKNQEIEFLKDRLIKYVELSRTKLYENLDQIKKRKIDLENQFVGLPGKRTEYTKTQRYYELYEEFYLSLMKNKAEFELAQAGTVTDFRILSPASSPGNPIAPNKILYYTVGAFAGLFISFIFVGIRYLLHNKVTSQQELERISSAFVLGSVPLFKFDKTSHSRLVVCGNLKSEISEAFRTIRTNMEFLNGLRQKTIITVSSTVSGEGKTFIAANLGGIISLLRNRVILIDLDMRRPRFHEVFDGIDKSKGLSTILINKHTVEECTHPTELDNLHFIPAGPVPPNPSELILSGMFDKLIQILTENYDVIIIDTPPVGLVTDGIYAMKIATIPIYVFRADFSKKNFLKNVERLVRVNKIKNLSLILNSARKGSGDGYSYGKGYYEESPKAPANNLKRLFRVK